MKANRMRRTARVLLLQAIFASAALADPRITFMRRIPPPHSLSPAEDLALIYAIGDNQSIRTFLDIFLDHANRSSSALRLTDVTNRQFVGHRPDEKVLERLRRQYKADAYVAIN